MRRAALAAALLAGGSGCGQPPREAAERCERSIELSDITAESPDLADHPYGGAAGWDHVDKYAPGVALADFDGDGALDLAQGRSDRGDPDLRGVALYRGRGDGRFESATELPWDPSWNATATLAFDYDGDGRVDLFVGIDGASSRLFRNTGDFKFEDVTDRAGLPGAAERVYAAAAGDVTGSGYPDLYLGQFAADLPDHGAGLADNVLLENRGDGTFAPPRSDLRCDGRSTLGVALADLDTDGDVDVYVANDYFPDCLYENTGGGAFREIARDAGVRDGAVNGMGIGVGDLTGDGALDVLVTDTERSDDSPGHAAYVQRTEPLRFDSAARRLGVDGLSVLPAGETWTVGWGVGIEDFDGDGRNEIHIATHEQRAELFFEPEGDRFELVGSASDALGSADARGSAYGDVDGDGAPDLVVGRRGDTVQIIRNRSGGRYLEVEVAPAHRALGAAAIARVGGARRVRPLRAGSSYMSSSPPIARFGLCSDEEAWTLEVRTPDGGRAAAQGAGPARVRLELGPGD